jgi:hypothetical protein
MSRRRAVRHVQYRGRRSSGGCLLGGACHVVEMLRRWGVGVSLCGGEDGCCMHEWGEGGGSKARLILYPMYSGIALITPSPVWLAACMLYLSPATCRMSLQGAGCCKSEAAGVVPRSERYGIEGM